MPLLAGVAAPEATGEEAQLADGTAAVTAAQPEDHPPDEDGGDDGR